MHTYLIEMLECPACHGDLDWRLTERDDRRVLAADIRCRACGTVYAVREGIGLFLTPELSGDDPWQQADSRLARFLREHPDAEWRLMQTPLDTLNPADQLFRALVWEERGHFAEAQAAEDRANVGLYTPEYLACLKSECEYVIEQLSTPDGPIVDLASGRGYLVKQLARQLQRSIVASDVSPRILRRDRDRLEFDGVYDAVSLLAFDARRTPFKSGSVKTLTTNLGLPNIREPGHLLAELRRIVDGTFLAISHFYPENDEVNARKIREMGMETLLYRRAALQSFVEAGWQANVAHTRLGKARPTPAGAVLEGATIDTLPAAETTLEWCVLEATPPAGRSDHKTPVWVS